MQFLDKGFTSYFIKKFGSAKLICISIGVTAIKFLGWALVTNKYLFLAVCLIEFPFGNHENVAMASYTASIIPGEVRSRVFNVLGMSWKLPNVFMPLIWAIVFWYFTTSENRPFYADNIGLLAQVFAWIIRIIIFVYFIPMWDEKQFKQEQLKEIIKELNKRAKTFSDTANPTPTAPSPSPQSRRRTNSFDIEFSNKVSEKSVNVEIQKE